MFTNYILSSFLIPPFSNLFPLYIIYNKVKVILYIDINQERIKNALKIEFFLGKVLVVQKKVVPLHPQIRNTS